MSDIKLALSQIETPPFTKPEIMEKVQHLPPPFQCLSSQLAGHDYAVFYDPEKKCVLKPIFDIRGVREETFYRLLFDPKYDQDPVLVKLRSFIPTYISTQRINDVSFVTLSDLTLDMGNASLMDVKIGSITYDRDATEEKIKNDSKKDILNRSIGFRVLAIKKWIEEEGVFEKVNRDSCRNCTSEQAEKNVLFFLEQPDNKRTAELTKSILEKLDEINEWFDKHNIDLFEFIGSSLFFIYSFDSDGKLECRVKMIDFAHIYPLEGSKIDKNQKDDKKDHNYLLGLNALINVIKKKTSFDQ